MSDMTNYTITVGFALRRVEANRATYTLRWPDGRTEICVCELGEPEPAPHLRLVKDDADG